MAESNANEVRQVLIELDAMLREFRRDIGLTISEATNSIMERADQMLTHVVDDRESGKAPPVKIKYGVQIPTNAPPAPVKSKRMCSKCGEPGHNARTCRKK